MIFSNTKNVSFGGPSNNVATGIITDNDSPTLRIVNVSGTEGSLANGALEFAIVLTPAPSLDPVLVTYATSDGTAVAPDDYTAQSGGIGFAIGDNIEYIQIPIIDDNVNEFDENFTLTISDFETDAVLSTVTGTIVDDDPIPSLTITQRVETSEGTTTNGQAVLEVSFSEVSGKNVTVQYATQQSSATEGTDYTAKTGTLTFAPGVSAQFITVDLIADANDEQDESFTVVLSNPVNAEVSGQNATGTVVIKDDDGAGVIEHTISIADVAVNEDAGSMSFQATLNADATAPVGVFWSASSETGNTAIEGADFIASRASFTDTSKNYFSFCDR